MQDGPLRFTKTSPDGKTLMMGVHVDDGLLVCDTAKQKDDLFKAMNKHFGVKDMGFPTSLLGCQYEKRHNGIAMHQEEYINEILRRCDFQECKPVPAPAVKDPTKTTGGNTPTWLIDS